MNFRSIFTSLCSGILISACAAAAPVSKELPKAAATPCQTIGGLVSARGLTLFNDARLSSQVTDSATIGIALTLSSPAQVLLTSGRVVWIRQIPNCVPSVLQARQVKFQASTLPLSHEGEDKFSWREVTGMQPLAITAISPQLNVLTPPYIAAQGRQLSTKAALNSFNWPQFNFVQDGQSLWADLNELDFRSATAVAAQGLVQKPFLSLASDVKLPPIDSVRYRDFTEKTLSEQPLPQYNWQLEQLIIPGRAASGLPRSVALYSAENNCTIIQVSWPQAKANYFGYCKAGAAAPTPVINGYKIAENNQGLALNLLEVSGDMEVPVVYNITVKDGVSLVKPR